MDRTIQPITATIQSPTPPTDRRILLDTPDAGPISAHQLQQQITAATLKLLMQPPRLLLLLQLLKVMRENDVALLDLWFGVTAEMIPKSEFRSTDHSEFRWQGGDGVRRSIPSCMSGLRSLIRSLQESRSAVFAGRLPGVAICRKAFQLTEKGCCTTSIRP